MEYFLDTEFDDQYYDAEADNRMWVPPAKLISLSLVTKDGRELYAINADYDRSRASDWLREHVIPQLDKPGAPAPVPETEIRDQVARFVDPGLDNKAPEFWAWVAPQDWMLLIGLFGRLSERPERWPKLPHDLRTYCHLLGNPKVPQQESGLHDCLEDARWNREVFQWLRTYERARDERRKARERERLLGEITGLVRGRR